MGRRYFATFIYYAFCRCIYSAANIADDAAPRFVGYFAEKFLRRYHAGPTSRSL